MANRHTHNRKQRRNRLIPKRLGGRREDDYLVVDMCRAFVRNFDNILRFGLAVACLSLVANIDRLVSLPDRVDEEPITVNKDIENTVEAPASDRQQLAREPFMNDNIRLHENCTRIEFRKSHKLECDVFESEAYGPREHAQDDDGFLFEDLDTLYARSGNGG